MRNGNVVIPDLNIRNCVRAAAFIEEQRIAFHTCRAVMRVRRDFQKPAVDRDAAAFANGFTDDCAGSVRRHVKHFGAGILPLAFVGEGDGHVVAARALPYQHGTRIEHGCT